MNSKTIMTAVVLLFLALIWTEPAHAYLDPGTGSAITYLLVSVGAAVYFVIRGILYAIRRKVTRKDAGDQDGSSISQERGIVIFSEGRDYWLTFKPVIEALIEKNHPFRYVTLDIEDPALAIESPFMQARHLGKGTTAFAKAAAMRADVMLSTTPNIGCPGYPFPRPKNVKCLAFVNHGLGEGAFMKKHGLDYYDAVLMVGQFMEEAIRFLENARGLRQKECYLSGLPLLDELSKKVKMKQKTNGRPVVLVAPSWGDRGSLSVCGAEYLNLLARSERFDIILRPHPQSWTKEKELLDGIIENISKFPHCRVDHSLDPSESLAEADVLISDSSGLKYEFAFLYEKPAVSIQIRSQALDGYEASVLGKCWSYDNEEKIGPVVKPDDLGAILDVVDAAIRFPRESIFTLRDQTVVNIGTAGKHVADWLVGKVKELGHESGQTDS